MTERDWEWRYLPYGKVTHALHLVGMLGRRHAAQCGVSRWSVDDWCGTGTQREYELVEEMPKCTKCLAKVGSKP